MIKNEKTEKRNRFNKETVYVEIVVKLVILKEMFKSQCLGIVLFKIVNNELNYLFVQEEIH